ncbi:MAG: hypothetical protein WDN03_14125 [Rhizomicrobium sp.]
MELIGLVDEAPLEDFRAMRPGDVDGIVGRMGIDDDHPAGDRRDGLQCPRQMQGFVVGQDDDRQIRHGRQPYSAPAAVRLLTAAAGFPI